jgi:hypothetical protein
MLPPANSLVPNLPPGPPPANSLPSNVIPAAFQTQAADQPLFERLPAIGPMPPVP